MLVWVWLKMNLSVVIKSVEGWEHGYCCCHCMCMCVYCSSHGHLLYLLLPQRCLQRIVPLDLRQAFSLERNGCRWKRLASVVRGLFGGIQQNVRLPWLHRPSPIFWDVLGWSRKQHEYFSSFLKEMSGYNILFSGFKKAVDCPSGFRFDVCIKVILGQKGAWDCNKGGAVSSQ